MLTKKTKKDFEKYLLATIEKYKPVLLLQQHTFTVSDGAEAYMEACFRYPYLNPLIKYSEKVFEDWKNGADVTETVVHEMCHYLTDPLYCKATERYVSKGEVESERELLTDTISSIVLRATRKI
jgi:hypothetical protein